MDAGVGAFASAIAPRGHNSKRTGTTSSIYHRNTQINRAHIFVRDYNAGMLRIGNLN
jgi:hypothetical protein